MKDSEHKLITLIYIIEYIYLNLQSPLPIHLTISQRILGSFHSVRSFTLLRGFCYTIISM